MNKTLFLLIALLISVASFAQSFEGKITYRNVYKSKMPNVTDDQFTAMMGTTQEDIIKDGDYKSTLDGSFMQWQLYINKDNKLYNKLANSETVLWNDGATNPDEVLKAELYKDAVEILGYKCDELVLTCKSGIQKYYFNAKISVDPTFYVNHKFGNWYEYISRTKALPLKAVVDNTQFTMESIATEIQPMVLDQSVFALPANVTTMKSPY